MLVAFDEIFGITNDDVCFQFENIMYTSKDKEATVKIIDFGLASRYDPSKGPLSKQVGTFDTMAPEVFGGNYTTLADLWSAGVVAYELISGRKPFAAMSQLAVIAKIGSGKYSVDDKYWKSKSAQSKNFVQSLLERNVDKRATASKALEHKWLQILPHGNAPVDTDSYRDALENQVILYGKSPQLKKIGLLLIAHKAFPQELVQLQTRFAKFDVENTGVISLEEFQTALREETNNNQHEFSDEQIQALFESMDIYKNGEVCYTEFVAAVLEMYGHVSEERIADAFDRLDATKTGYISVTDLRVVLGKDFSEEVADDIIAEVDYKQDGKGKFLTKQTQIGLLRVGLAFHMEHHSRLILQKWQKPLLTISCSMFPNLVSYEEFLKAFRSNGSKLGSKVIERSE